MFDGFLIKSTGGVVFSVFSQKEVEKIKEPLDHLSWNDLVPKNGEISKHKVNKFNTYVYSPNNIPSAYILVIGDLEKDSVEKAKRTFNEIDNVLSPKYTAVLKTEKLSSAMFAKNKELKNKIQEVIEDVEEKINEENNVVEDIRSQYFD